MKALTAMTALLAAACAPMDERAEEQRTYDRVDFQAKFVEFRKRCHKRGGIVFVQARNRIRSQKLPRPGDGYRCM